jgi:glutaconate CoA-transferase subunit A
MDSISKSVGVELLASQVKNGDLVVLPSSMSGDFSAASMVATRALIRRGIKDLHLLGLPALNFQADLLIGAGCVRTAEAGSMLMYEHGAANRFVAAQKNGSIEVIDSSCPAIYSALIAGAKGIPFMVVRGFIGSDLVRLREQRGDWAVIPNPFGKDDPVVAVSAIRPDIALFHVPLADRFGNVWYGKRDALATMARAAHKTLVTFEELYDGDLYESEELAAATIPSNFITLLSQHPKGSWPLHCGDRYPDDTAHLREYAQMSKTDAGFDEYLKRYVMELQEAEYA